MDPHAAFTCTLDNMPNITLLDALTSAAELQHLANLPGNINEPVWSQAQLAAAVNGSELVLAIALDEEIVGYMVANYVLDQADIYTILVARRSRGKGVAKNLLKAMVALLQEREVEQVFLEVRASNEPAQALYKGNGFVETGRRKNYYTNEDGSREDAIVMQRDLLAHN